MSRFSLSHLPGTERALARIDRALRWRAGEEVGRHLDGVYGRLDQLNDRIDELERRLEQPSERRLEQPSERRLEQPSERPD